MPKLSQLFAAILMSSVACQPVQPLSCNLTPEALLHSQRISMRAISLHSDTLDITSDDELCWQPLGTGDSLHTLPTFHKEPRQVLAYGHKIPAWYFID